MMNQPTPLDTQTTVAVLLSACPQAAAMLLRHHVSCIGCDMAVFDTLEDVARNYNLNLGILMHEINQVASSPTPAPTPTQEHLMDTPYTFFPNIGGTVAAIPDESIVSRTVFRGEDNLKAIVFAFAPGQELSEHTASVPAIIQILEGECTLTLGEDRYEVQAGAWARMPAQLKHSVLAKTPVKILLIML